MSSLMQVECFDLFPTAPKKKNEGRDQKINLHTDGILSRRKIWILKKKRDAFVCIWTLWILQSFPIAACSVDV